MKSLKVGIKFQKGGRIYNFSSKDNISIGVGDYVVVETSRGKQIGRVVVVLNWKDEAKKEKLKPIIRKATPRDLLIRQLWQKKEIEALSKCKEKAEKLNIRGMKLVSAEYTFDGRRLTIMYYVEGGERIDLGGFNKEIVHFFPRQKVELKQIGPRDVAKFIGGLGACGMKTRCCTMFLNEFAPISIKMAKIQGISLAPSEITGMCGRLRCCLMYENEQYLEMRAKLPKKGKNVITPLGEGKVTKTYPLSEMILVDIEKIGKKKFSLEEIKLTT